MNVIGATDQVPSLGNSRLIQSVAEGSFRYWLNFNFNGTGVLDPPTDSPDSEGDGDGEPPLAGGDPC